MSPISRSLQQFISRRESILIQSLSAAVAPVPEDGRSEPETAASSSATTSVTPEAKGTSEVRITTQMDSESKETGPRQLFDTKYGLRVLRNLQPNGSARYSVQLAPSQSCVEPVQTKNDHRLYHYRIFPDWQTSFFWKNPKYLVGTGEVSEVDEDVVEEMYPQLAPFFFSWRDVFDEAFEKQELHLGVKAEVFPDLGERVTWCIEGFLMASWLVLQQQVASVEYSPEEKAYMLDKMYVNDELQAYLDEMDALVENRREGQ
jgi:hypothetical protein